MVWDVVISGFTSAFAGIIAAGFGAWISKQREKQTWVENEVYQPIYNEIHNATLGEMPHNYSSVWGDFNHYKKIRVDNEIRKNLNEYERYIKNVSHIENRADYEIWYENIASKLPSEIIETDDGKRKLRASPFESEKYIYRDMDEWYDRHLSFLDEWKSNGNDIDGREKEEKLRTISEEAGWNYERLYDCWRTAINFRGIFRSWGDELHKAYSDAMGPVQEGMPQAAHSRRRVRDKAIEIESLMNSHIEQNLFEKIIYH